MFCIYENIFFNFFYIKKMTNIYIKTTKKDSRERYQNLFEEEKDNRQKKSKKDIKMFLRTKSISFFRI